MAVLYCLNDNLSSKMNFQHFNIHRLQMQTQKNRSKTKKNGRNCPVSGAWCSPPHKKKNYFVNFPAREKCHRLLENSRNAAKNLLWPVEADNRFSYFFYKSVFFFFLNCKKYKKNPKKSNDIKNWLSTI